MVCQECGQEFEAVEAGHRFLNKDNHIYLVAKVDDDRYCLIDPISGNRWGKSILTYSPTLKQLLGKDTPEGYEAENWRKV